MAKGIEILDSEFAQDDNYCYKTANTANNMIEAYYRQINRTESLEGPHHQNRGKNIKREKMRELTSRTSRNTFNNPGGGKARTQGKISVKRPAHP